MFWVVEAHADDAFLSLHDHMVGPWKDEELTIVTVFSSERRQREVQEYASRIGARSIWLGYPENKSMRSPCCVEPSLEDKLEEPFQQRDRLILPVGIQHPEHLATAQMSESRRVWRYLDTPGYAKRKLADEVNGKIKNLRIVSLRKVHKSKWKHVELFKSQSKFFYFNSPEKLPQVEIVLR